MATALLKTPKLLTAERFVRDCSDRRAELIDGRVVELPMPGWKHGHVIIQIVLQLAGFVKERQLGRCFCNDTFVVTRRKPDRVRGMDVGYVSYDRWSKKRDLDDGPVPAVPELIFEVLSTIDRKREVGEKVNEYLNLGVSVVVVVDPKKKSAIIHRTNEDPETVKNGETFELPDILPGFSTPVARFFE